MGVAAREGLYVYTWLALQTLNEAGKTWCLAPAVPRISRHFPLTAHGWRISMSPLTLKKRLIWFDVLTAVHVAATLERDDVDYLAALDNETSTLRKRVDACRSRIMYVTCFDVIVWRRVHSDTTQLNCVLHGFVACHLYGKTMWETFIFAKNFRIFTTNLIISRLLRTIF